MKVNFGEKLLDLANLLILGSIIGPIWFREVQGRICLGDVFSRCRGLDFSLSQSGGVKNGRNSHYCGPDLHFLSRYGLSYWQRHEKKGQ